MEVNIETLKQNPERGKIRYIFPGDNDQGYAKMISALANIEGGNLLLGISDDGKKLHTKGYTFSVPKKEKLVELLDGFDNFSIEEILYDNKHFVNISVNKESDGIKFEGNYYMFSSSFNNTTVPIQPVKLFISYNHKVSELTDIIEEELTKKFGPKVHINRDTSLKYRDSIEDFMVSIKQNDLVVSLISNSYMKSEACMYEITELMKDDNFKEKLAYIVLSQKDAKLFSKEIDSSDLVPNVYGGARFGYVEYWTLKKNEYDSQMERLKDNHAATVELNQVVKRMAIISQGVGPFVEHLNSSKGLDFTSMQEDDFSEVHSLIEKTFEQLNRKQ
ncbi:ATP-binding protein [Enterococcus faecalis]|uniref:ATP-binding protein n=1 Tax=Enterococcus faecalis TaxID=1351 RepID=UPI003D7741DB